MNTRLALYDWIARCGLDEARSRSLWRIAGFDEEPAAVARHFRSAVAILGAALAGFGVILWLAANWAEFGRMGRFALLEAGFLAAAVAAASRPAWRSPLALLALLLVGGLFAYFGQTYQTGADAWQLFAVWALLSLPLCLAARSDVLWAPWALVAMVCISTWTYAHAGHRWAWRDDATGVYFAAWIAAVAIVAAFSGAPARRLGAGAWPLRTAGTLAVVVVSVTALGALFQQHVAAHYWLALVLFAAAGALLSLPHAFEVFLLSAVALALDTLVVVGLGRWMFFDARSSGIDRLFLIGLVAAGVLAASVSFILRAARRARGEIAHE
jgi:uncharacterized membrane protein